MSSKKYLFNKTTNEKVCINGCIPSEEPSEAAAFSNFMVYQADQLPPAVDLRPKMTPIENQYNTASCVANALAGAYEYLLKQHQLQNIDVSRLFIYYNARVRSFPGRPIQDIGCYIPKAIESLQSEGTCLEKEWPFSYKIVNNTPHGHLYNTAKTNNIAEQIRLNIDINEMKTCLAQGYPFVFCLRLYRSLPIAKTNGGFVPNPQPGEPLLGIHSAHAMLAVGYVDQYRLFIVRNSWGTEWGDKGYLYIPYDYMGNQNQCWDAFAIRKLNNMDLGRDSWITDISQVQVSEPTFIGAGAEEELSKWSVKDASDVDDASTASTSGDGEQENTEPQQNSEDFEQNAFGDNGNQDQEREGTLDDEQFE